MKKLCVGIISFNRLHNVQRLVNQLKTFTRAPHEIVVSDGGSSDGTPEWCHERGIRTLSGPDLGPGRSKNLALYYFLHHTDADQVILLEDDTYVWEPGWENEWMTAASLWHHVNWPLDPDGRHDHGSVTPHHPIRTTYFAGAATITTREALQKVGFIDPRFLGYGGEHAEWTWRFERQYRGEWGEPAGTVPCISAHIGASYEHTHFKGNEFQRGMDLMHKLLKEDSSIYRDPWQNEAEKAEFLGIIERCLLVKPVQDIVAGERCPICAGFGSVIGKKQGVDIRVCCGILLSWAWASEQSYEDFYKLPDLYHDCEQKEGGQKPYWDRDAELLAANRERFKFFKVLRPELKRFLDIGAGTGALVQVARESGCDAHGLEPNAKMVKGAVNKQRPVKLGSWRDAVEKWEVITLHDVFEHLTRPKECLLALRDRLNPAGLLNIEMPEAGCAQAVRDKLEWKHIRPRQHVCLYSDDAARKLFASCGYEIEMMVRPKQGELGKISYFLRPALLP